MFFKCRTKEDVEKIYEQLSFYLHPDRGGCPMIFNLLEEAKDNMLSIIDELDADIDQKKKHQGQKYEPQLGNIEYGDPRLEILTDHIRYKHFSPKFSIEFAESLCAYLDEKGYITSSQYNCLVKTYYAFKMWEKLEDE